MMEILPLVGVTSEICDGNTKAGVDGVWVEKCV